LEAAAFRGKMRRMRIAIMAAGAVGGYFGARLAAAGHEVHFIARGAQLAAIRKQGLRVQSTLGDLHVAKADATSDPAAVGPVDVVLFAVKLWDTEVAGAAARPLVGPRTRLITLQNGIDSVERLRPILGDEAVIGGTTHIAAVISEPGRIVHSSPFARMTFGRSDRKPDAALAAFAEAARGAGIDATVSDDIEADRWKKFAFLVALSGATGAMRLPLGPILGDPETRAFFKSLIQELVTLGIAKGVTLPPEFVEESLRFGDAAPPGFKASLLHDLEAGRRLELDWLAGKVVELGRELTIPTPANSAVYTVLKLHRMGRA
jgi:2-dehydropantoate 2-reductase